MGKSKNKNTSGGHSSGSQSYTPPFIRGRGGGPGGRGRGGRGGGQHHQGPKTPGSSFLQEDLDFTVRMYADSPNPQQQASSSASGYATPRGGGGRRGRGRGFNQVYRGSNHNFNGHARGRGGYGGSDLRGNEAPRGRGRGRGEDIGYSPRRGRGLGASVESTPTKLGPNSTLSELLLASRPLLRPVKFVQAQHTPFLFQQKEEILQPVAEQVGDDETSHAPTADRVERIFHGVIDPFQKSDSSSSEGEEEEVEEVDFNDMGKLLASPKQTVVTSKRKVKADNHSAEPQVTHSSVHSKPAADPLFVIDTQPGPLPSSLELRRPETPSEDEEIIVYVAPHPKQRSSLRSTTTRKEDHVGPLPGGADTSAFVPYVSPAALSLASMSIRDSPPPLVPESIPEPAEQGPSPEPELEERLITAPTTTIPVPSVEALKFGFSSSVNKLNSESGRKLPAVMSPRMAKQQKAWERKKAGRERKRKGKSCRASGRFAAFGAMLDDARLYEDVFLQQGKDSKWEQRRRGDSDVDWGTEDEDEGGSGNEESHVIDYISPVKSEKAKGKGKVKHEDDAETEHGMQVDSDMDVAAMKDFVSGLMGRDAGVHMTMDDVEIEDKIRIEDGEGVGGAQGSSDESDEDEVALDVAERLLIGESESDDEGGEFDDESEDGVDISPKSGFQARLERLREKSRGKKPVDGVAVDDESDAEMLAQHMTWAEGDYDDYDDDDLIAQIEDILDEHADVIQDFERKGRNKLFRAVTNGDFADMQPAGKRKDKWKNIPEGLQEQWERDRQKKAKRKRERELQKLIESSDPYTEKRGGKKGRKIMLRASRLDPTLELAPNRIIDLTTLVQQIRRFVADLGGPLSMSLPPTNKETRKNVHELATAFGLKSVSKGKGDARYTTLSKTTRTGQRADEAKVAKIMRSAGGPGARGDSFGSMEFEGKGGVRVPKHREGERVGASAPKIGEANVGFKMLAAMGWAEGDRIGLSGGLEAPLVAIIKHSKLGLGATK